jgi:hypothetical protein
MLLDTNRSPLKRIDIFIPFVLILGITIPVVLYSMIMVSIGWSAPILGSGSVSSLFGNRSTAVTLYESESSRAHFAKLGGNYENLLKPWRSYFQDRKTGFKSIGSEAEIAALKDGVLILPSSIALSDLERNAIMAFREKGGSVLATWATGTRTNDGEWSGWQFLELLGAKHLGAVENNNIKQMLVLDGQSPVSNTLPAGQRYVMASTGEQLLRLKGEHSAALFANEQRINTHNDSREGAIVYSEAPTSFSRSAVFAFSENAWESRPQVMYNLIDDTLKWLNRDVVATRATWPEGKKAAQVISSDGSNNLEMAVEVSSKLQSKTLPSTCFVSANIAKANLKTTNLLSRVCEVAAAPASSSTDGQSTQALVAQLQATKADLGSVFASGGKTIGISVGSNLPPLSIESALTSTGFKYYTSNKQSESRLPEFAKTPEPDPAVDLLRLPIAQRDQAYFKQFSNPDLITQQLKDDFNQILREGSLGWLHFNADQATEGTPSSKAFQSHIELFGKYRQNIWFANAGQINDWWRNRERLKLDTAYNGKRFDINLTVKGTEPLSGAALIVMLPKKNANLEISGTKIGMQIPTVTVLDEYRALLNFNQLAPGNYSYQVTFSKK